MMNIEQLCDDCGKFVAPYDLNKLCRCFWKKKSNHKTVQGHPRKLEREKLMEELGMPSNANFVRLELDGKAFGDKGRGYFADIFGVGIQKPLEPDSDYPFFIILEPDGSKSDYHVQLWLQRISYENSQVYGEIRFHPDRGCAYAIKGEVQKSSREEILRAYRGFAALARLPKLLSSAGRPLDTGFILEANKHEVLIWVIEQGKRIYKATNKISQAALAENCRRFGLKNRRSLTRLIERCGKDWKKDILPEIKKKPTS
jgi:hypothetical protein